MVGWIVMPHVGGFIWYPPKTFLREVGKSPAAKSLTKCPAVLDLESRYYLIRAPFDIQFELLFSKKNGVQLKYKDSIQSSISSNTLNALVYILPSDKWRHPEKPILMIKTPYHFVTDDTVYLSQVSPFLHYQAQAWPGIVLSERFPIKIWPKALNWYFEWHDLKQALSIKRGAPWWMVSFETQNPDKKVRLIEAELTDPLEGYFKKITGATMFEKNWRSLFQLAALRRPKQLLLPKQSH